MSEVKGVFITGVGGQGIILASELLSEVARLAGMDVKKSEVHGMAQRGGSVMGHVKFGDEVHSPLITEGEADVLLSFEKLEAVRYINFVKPDGMVIVNDQEIAPAPVAAGVMDYPENTWDRVREAVPNALLIPGMELAKEAGNVKATNVVLLGALSAFLPFDEALWKKAIENKVPPKFVEMNMKAFELGRKAAER
ncbi:MAG TPA: indolepyruvate oxidoreductase subunit beta [candidate division Zixibacteria bacterium]|nr:indolepyruvate oxidoreductase subunit beta [candidate division Zixibacteria bacterium]